MFDIGWPELMVVMIIALIVIGPKDLPAALRQLGKWVGAARRMSSEFQKHVDDIVRESELDDVKRGIDRVRSVNIKRELEKQIDPDGSLNKAFGGSVGSNSSGKPSRNSADTKSWRAGGDGVGGAIGKPSMPNGTAIDSKPVVPNSTTADALTTATSKTAGPSPQTSAPLPSGSNAPNSTNSGANASGPNTPEPNISGPKPTSKPAEPITTDQA